MKIGIDELEILADTTPPVSIANFNVVALAFSNVSLSIMNTVPPDLLDLDAVTGIGIAQ